MDKDIKFPDRHARRESCIWFPVIVDGKFLDCTITDKFIDSYLREGSVASDEDIYMTNRDIINKLVEYKIKNDLFNKDGSISIKDDYDADLLKILKT